MTLTKKALLSLVITGALFVGFLVGLTYFKSANEAIGNILPGAEMHATTTGIGAGFALGVNNITFDCGSTKGCSGTLGTITFTTPTTGVVEFYDATTTNVNLRTSNIASSSLLIAHFPAGTGTSTIPMNTLYRYGLIMVSENVSTSTIIYRNNY